jgi:hypothetical protein
MRYFKLIVLLIIASLFINCEKKDEFVNRTTNAQVVGFVTEKCYCCWGWVIKIGTNTIKTENIPNLNYSPDSTVFPIMARITIGSKTIDCSEKMADYYEIKEIILIK